MDSNFDFLSSEQIDMLRDILIRQNPALGDRFRQSRTITRSDAEKLMYTLGDELTDNLDDDWEPTDYGREVSRILALVNAARVREWPD